MEILKETGYTKFIMDYLVELAKKSTCHRSKCASIVVVGHQVIIGAGYNSMPCNATGECFKESLSPTFKSDKTCCVHAEQRAIIDCLKGNLAYLLTKGSSLFFIRLDENLEPKHSGKPYCSICSKMALDVGISKFVLWHHQGWTAYDTKEYNDLTFKY